MYFGHTAHKTYQWKKQRNQSRQGCLVLLLWVLGFSVEPVEESKVSISESESCKVVSTAQDLVYIASKGKMFTHKSLALAMTTRT